VKCSLHRFGWWIGSGRFLSGWCVSWSSNSFSNDSGSRGSLSLIPFFNGLSWKSLSSDDEQSGFVGSDSSSFDLSGESMDNLSARSEGGGLATSNLKDNLFVVSTTDKIDSYHRASSWNWDVCEGVSGLLF
jgi:hypothetical protein